MPNYTLYIASYLDSEFKKEPNRSGLVNDMLAERYGLQKLSWDEQAIKIVRQKEGGSQRSSVESIDHATNEPKPLAATSQVEPLYRDKKNKRL